MGNSRRVIWEWAVPLLLFLLAAGLVEVGHLSPTWWWRLPVVMLGWLVLWLSYHQAWRRWRAAEVERLRHEALPHGGRPRITLIVGQDLCTGQAAVVNDRGFVVEPDEPLPPPPEPTRVAARRSDPDDAGLDVDGLSGP